MHVSVTACQHHVSVTACPPSPQRAGLRQLSSPRRFFSTGERQRSLQEGKGRGPFGTVATVNVRTQESIEASYDSLNSNSRTRGRRALRNRCALSAQVPSAPARPAPSLFLRSQSPQARRPRPGRRPDPVAVPRRAAPLGAERRALQATQSQRPGTVTYRDFSHDPATVAGHSTLPQ